VGYLNRKRSENEGLPSAYLTKETEVHYQYYVSEIHYHVIRFLFILLTAYLIIIYRPYKTVQYIR